jgi:biopolymer transport protein ExbD
MALTLQNEEASDEVWLAEINTTPLVDVMLVLLIIFLLTVPVVSASVNLRLPVQNAQQQDTSGDYVIISVDAAGRLYLNDDYMQDAQALAAQIEPLAARMPRVQLHIRAHGNAPYSLVSPVIELAQGFGFSQVSMLTEPAAAAPARK